MKLLLMLILCTYSFALTQNKSLLIPDDYTECYQIDGYSFHYSQDYSCHEALNHIIFSTPNKALILGEPIYDSFSWVMERAYNICDNEFISCAEIPDVTRLDTENGVTGAFISFEVDSSTKTEFTALTIDLKNAPGGIHSILFWVSIDAPERLDRAILEGFLEQLYIEFHDAAG